MKLTAMAAAAAALSILATAPVLAVQGDPVPGADVSAEQSPGGIMITTSQCAQKHGTLNTRKGKLYCDLPIAKPVTKPLAKPVPGN